MIVPINPVPLAPGPVNTEQELVDEDEEELLDVADKLPVHHGVDEGVTHDVHGEEVHGSEAVPLRQPQAGAEEGREHQDEEGEVREEEGQGYGEDGDGGFTVGPCCDLLL